MRKLNGPQSRVRYSPATREHVVAAIRRHPYATSAEIAAIVGVSRDTVARVRPDVFGACRDHPWQELLTVAEVDRAVTLVLDQQEAARKRIANRQPMPGDVPSLKALGLKYWGHTFADGPRTLVEA